MRRAIEAILFDQMELKMTLAVKNYAFLGESRKTFPPEIKSEAPF